VSRAIRHGEPLVSRVVTVSGLGIREPANVEVPLGTPLEDLLAFCGGLHPVPSLLIGGGPMMGTPMPSLQAPVVKGTSGVLALTSAEINDGPEAPCIRCGSCVTACPCGLVPVEMAQLVKRGKLDEAKGIGLQDCISLRLLLVHLPFAHSAGALLRLCQGQARRAGPRRAAAGPHPRLIQARTARVEREAEVKKAAAAARKAAKAASVAAAAAAKSAVPSP
jgi:electron transport complex protein RnfC